MTMLFENLTGQVLGQYELRTLLGMGGMGAVYRAYQPRLAREVAIKVMSLALAQQSGYLDRFMVEARTSAALDHPNIIPIYDFGTQQSVNYVVMKLLTGGTLVQRMRQREEDGRARPSLGEVSNLLNQLASALDYAHSMDVIHRDLKPGNIMFDNQGRVFLVDFGIAKLMSATSALTGTGLVMGTPAYMAPEQWRDESLTGTVDQYALAVLVYQLLAGRLPYEANSTPALMYKHFNEQPTPLHTVRRDLPSAIMTVLSRALAKSSGERYKTMTAFAQAFDSAIEGERGTETHFFTFKVRSDAPMPQVSLAPIPSKPNAVASKAVPTYQRPAIWAVVIAVMVLVGLMFFLLLPSENRVAPMLTSAAETIVALSQPTVMVQPLYTITSALPALIASTDVVTVISPSPINDSVPLVMQLPTETPTPIPTVTLIPTDTSTSTFTATVTATATLTSTVTYTQTFTPAPTATNTSTSTFTATATATATLTSTATYTLTFTPVPTATDTSTSTFTATLTHTYTHTPTNTVTATSTATWTATATPQPTPTRTSTSSPTINASRTSSPESSAVVTPTLRAEPSQTRCRIRVGSDSALRLGPGLHRSIRMYAGQVDALPVQYQILDEDGNRWFQLDATDARDERMHELWVAEDVVIKLDACDKVPQAAASVYEPRPNIVATSPVSVSTQVPAPAQNSSPVINSAYTTGDCQNAHYYFVQWSDPDSNASTITAYHTSGGGIYASRGVSGSSGTAQFGPYTCPNSPGCALRFAAQDSAGNSSRVVTATIQCN